VRSIQPLVCNVSVGRTHSAEASRRLFCGGLASLLAGRVNAGESRTGDATAEDAVHSFPLDNGMRVIVAERPQASQIAVQLYCDAGIAQETAGTTGVFHVLRHIFLLQAHAAGWKDARGATRLDANTLIWASISPSMPVVCASLISRCSARRSGWS
jgi:hypothetical protein